MDLFNVSLAEIDNHNVNVFNASMAPYYVATNKKEKNNNYVYFQNSNIHRLNYNNYTSTGINILIIMYIHMSKICFFFKGLLWKMVGGEQLPTWRLRLN